MSIKRVKTTKFPSGFGYKIDFRRAGHPRIQRTFETRKLAQDVLDTLSGDAVRKEFGLPIDSHVTLAELIERHLSVMRKRGRDKTNTKRAETVLNRFADIAGAEIMVEKIRRSDLRAYTELRLMAEVKPQTINREMNEIKGCLTKATQYFAALEDWQPPKGAWLEEPTDGRRQTWDHESDAKVLAELMGPKRKGENDSHVSGRRAVGEIFQIVRRTGMRPGEVRNLKKGQLDFKSRIIIITSKKGMSERRTARSREIPMPDEVYEILSRRFTEARGPYIFPGNSPDKPLSAYLSVFRKACKRAGVPYGLSSGLIMYDARRTAENEMLDAGHSPRAVGDIFGHSAETMAKHYARSTREQRRRAVESTNQKRRELDTNLETTITTGATGKESKAKKASSGE